MFTALGVSLVKDIYDSPAYQIYLHAFILRYRIEP